HGPGRVVGVFEARAGGVGERPLAVRVQRFQATGYVRIAVGVDGDVVTERVEACGEMRHEELGAAVARGWHSNKRWRNNSNTHVDQCSPGDTGKAAEFQRARGEVSPEYLQGANSAPARQRCWDRARQGWAGDARAGGSVSESSCRRESARRTRPEALRRQ